MTTALILILVSAVVHAVVNVLTKRADDKYAMRLLIGVFRPRSSPLRCSSCRCRTVLRSGF